MTTAMQLIFRNDILYPNVRNFTTELTVAELIDPVRELMPALKWVKLGLKDSNPSLTPLYPHFNSRTVSMNSAIGKYTDSNIIHCIK